MELVKKWAGLLLVGIMAVSSLSLVHTTQASVPNYDPQAALAFARQNAMRTDINWLCAEFVARAVRAGGLDVDILRGTGPLNRAIARTLGINWTAGTNPPASIPRLQLNASGHATQALNGNTLMPGDVVFQFCMETTTGCAGPISPHVLIFSRYDGDGIARFYGRNQNIADARWALDHRTQGRRSLHPNCRDIAGFVLQIAPRTGGNNTGQTPLATYTVRYDANGGNGAPASHGWRLEDGFIDYILVANTVPTRAGYRFLGWSTQRDGSASVWQPGETVTSHTGPHNWTLYAQWAQAAPPTPAPPQGLPPVIGDTIIPDGVVNTFFGGPQGLHLLVGSSRDATWRISAGALPQGVTLTEDARFRGSPTEAGTFTFTVEARNNYGVATRNFTVNIAPSPNIYVTVHFDTNGGTGNIANEQLRIAPYQNVGIVFIQEQHTTTKSGHLFLGWVVPGIVDIPNLSQVFVSREALGGRTEITAIAQWTPIESPLQPYIIYGSLRDGRVGIPYLQTESEGERHVQIRNNLTDNWDDYRLYPFVVVDGALPPGMGINRIGIFNGTPTQAGVFTFTVRFTNPSGHFVEQEYILTIHP